MRLFFINKKQRILPLTILAKNCQKRNSVLHNSEQIPYYIKADPKSYVAGPRF